MSAPEAREFDRLCTTVANAYIQPLMAGYLGDIQMRFEQAGLRCPILMMTAGGGMTTLATAARLPIRLVESGPAGGAVLAARLAAQTGETDVLSFDMGGTTAKLSLIDGFRPQMSRKFEIARAARFVKGSGMPCAHPGDRDDRDWGRRRVHRLRRPFGTGGRWPPQRGVRAGSGGFWQRRGADPTVTDADIALGYIDPDQFAEGRLRIDRPASEAALSETIGAALGLAADGAATAVTEIVDEAMASAARMHAVESGKDLTSRVMIAFGGNGPLHATRVARRAGVRRILIPPDPGVGSAIGFLFAPVSFELIRSHYASLDDIDLSALNTLFDEMRGVAEEVVRAAAPDARLTARRTAFMRYHGQGHEIEIDLPDGPLSTAEVDGMRSAFEAEYSRQFGRRVPGMQIEVLNWGLSLAADPPALGAGSAAPETQAATHTQTRAVWCNITGAWRDMAVLMRADLTPGAVLPGPR